MGEFVFWGIMLIATAVMARRLYAHFNNQAQAQHSVAVLVVDKHVREFMGQTRKQHTEPPQPRVQYYVTFRPLEDADERVFRVSQPLYERLMPSQTGTLVFQGSRFIAFELDEANPGSG